MTFLGDVYDVFEFLATKEFLGPDSSENPI